VIAGPSWKHSESEKAYIEENVVHSPLVLKSDFENGTLSWIAKGSKIEFRVYTVLHDQFVTMLNAVVLDPGTAETVSKIQKNAWATLKFRDAPWTITDIKAFQTDTGQSIDGRSSKNIDETNISSLPCAFRRQARGYADSAGS
jgi:hypothetical protein